MEMGLVETIKRERIKAGDITTKGNGNFDATGRLKTVQKKPNAKEILDRIENEKKTNKKITEQGMSNPKAPQVNVQMLIDAFKGTLVTDQDKMGYTNFRYPGSKRIIFYCIARNFGVTVSLHDDTSKNGYHSEKIISKQDLQTFVASIQVQVDNTSKYASAFVPIFRCPCGYETQSKTEMQTHIGTHGSD